MIVCVYLYNDTKLTITRTYALIQAICDVVSGVSVKATRKRTFLEQYQFSTKRIFCLSDLFTCEYQLVYPVFNNPVVSRSTRFMWEPS